MSNDVTDDAAADAAFAKRVAEVTGPFVRSDELERRAVSRSELHWIVAQVGAVLATQSIVLRALIDGKRDVANKELREADDLTLELARALRQLVEEKGAASE